MGIWVHTDVCGWIVREDQGGEGWAEHGGRRRGYSVQGSMWLKDGDCDPRGCIEDRRRREDPCHSWAGRGRGHSAGVLTANRARNNTGSTGIWAGDGSSWSVKFLIGGSGRYADAAFFDIENDREGSKSGQGSGRTPRIFLHVNSLCPRLCRSHRVLYLAATRHHCSSPPSPPARPGLPLECANGSQ